MNLAVNVFNFPFPSQFVRTRFFLTSSITQTLLSFSLSLLKTLINDRFRSFDSVVVVVVVVVVTSIDPLGLLLLQQCLIARLVESIAVSPLLLIDEFELKRSMKTTTQSSGYDVNELYKEAQNRWLKPAEVFFILQDHENHKLTETPPLRPHGGSLFLFNKRVLRFFRKDGHAWRKKKDGRTVVEAHERLKVGNVEALNCYYAHGEHNANFQRRSYWMLDPAFEHIVLVHYREITEGKHGIGSSSVSSPSSTYTSTQSLSLRSSQNPVSASAVSELYEPCQSSYSPVSVEVSSELMTRNNTMDHLESKDKSQYVSSSSPDSEVSQALRRIEEQLSLNDNDRAELSSYYNEEKLKDSQVSIHDMHTNNETFAAVESKENGVHYETYADDLDDSYRNLFLRDSVNDRKLHQHQFGSESRIERKESPYWKEMLEFCSQLTSIDSYEDSDNLSDPSGKPLPTTRENSLKENRQIVNSVSRWLNSNGNDSTKMNEFITISKDSASLKAASQFLLGSDNLADSPTSFSLPHGDKISGASLYSSPTTDGANPDDYSMWFDQESQMRNLGSESKLTLTKKQKFSIRTICPEWGYASENSKVIVAGSFLCDPSVGEWACMFGDIEVPVEIIQEGVLLCQAPPNTPGKVTFCITSSNRESCSEIREFEYIMKCSCDPLNLPQVNASMSTEELLLIVRLAQMLRSDSRVQKENASAFDILRRPETDDYQWDGIIEELLLGSKSPLGIMDWLLQELLKEKMQMWLSTRCKGGIPGCSLSKKEQCVIHMVAGLGYEWALNPILHSGISINFRDVNGWTALHWAARFGREKMVAALIAAGASAVAVTDPTSQDSAGKTAGFIAAASGHKGLAGYLSELALTSHLSSLMLEESEISKGSAAVEAEKTVENISRRSLGYNEDQLSLKDSLAAVRNAAQAAARIQAAFRAHSFMKRQQSQAPDASYDEYGTVNELLATSKLAFQNHRLDRAALSIQKNYRGWKGRKDFLSMRQKVVRIQAELNGNLTKAEPSFEGDKHFMENYDDECYMFPRDCSENSRFVAKAGDIENSTASMIRRGVREGVGGSGAIRGRVMRSGKSRPQGAKCFIPSTAISFIATN
ncbi:hypothetical protein Sjap_016520 [Stephania japonica]|uniref:CG-1 domain-containing protein n=1 Tax=Stephania japonica TaxID=461633 RepID=A0AAP0IMC4_9MAGN